ncbi:hypothetical protein AVEN_167059-1 [Araneus ventricosus]|uniref:Uncharacterized protein n=1 Tax=Araneus ventricosus TaxID=182803 RepID=A0A4Y2CSA9_ARAVE|nr:hypothetical protein AVEN_167059-1 [Araneus ventricosus]
MIWRESTNHVDDCYFYMVPPVCGGFTNKKKRTIVCPNITSALRPVSHGKGLPIPEPISSISSDEEDLDVSHNSPHRQHVVANLLEENVRVISFRTRHLLFESFFKKEESLVFCCDIDGLLKDLRIAHEPNEWRLFIDDSKLSLKAVLLNYGDELPSIPVAHAIYMKETYHNLNKLLEMINYSKHGWQICADLKVVSLLMGLQLGYTKYCCFLCLWDSIAIALHDIKKDWPQRASFKP